MTTNQSVPLPPAAVTAYQLAIIAAGLPGAENIDRDYLHDVAELLAGRNPDTEAAHAAALRGVAHAIRPNYTEERPETYLLSAVAALLGGGERAGFPVLPPVDSELEDWCDLLNEISKEAESGKPVTASGDGRSIRMAKLQSMRLWLSSARLVQHLAAQGEAVPTDPEALPLGSTTGTKN